MQSKDKILEIAQKLPFGSIKIIAEKLNINARTVDSILKGKKAMYKNVVNVLREAKSIIKEYEELTEL